MISIKFREIKRVYLELVDAQAGRSREKCPPPQDLYASLEPRTSRRSKKNIADHLTRCKPCLEEFRILLALYVQKQKTVHDIYRLIAPAQEKSCSRPQASFHHQNPTSFRRTVRGRAWLIAAPVLLAAVLAFVAIFYMPISLTNTADQRERSASAEELTLVYPASGNECARSALAFKWTPRKDADYYRLELFDESLRSLWQSPCLFEPSIIPPPEVVQSLLSKKKYFWMISAQNSDGRRMESPLGYFIMK